jgi:hypothetical protein
MLSVPAAVMPSGYHVDPAIQAAEVVFCQLLPKQCEISQVIYGVVGLDNIIPILDQGIVHFRDRRVWAFIVSDHVSMSEVGVGGEPDLLGWIILQPCAKCQAEFVD